ncbi:T9SS type A sorting domain-containing protein [Flavobacterium sp. J372]|uniref:T9SS type A sorting domain-containing protein n=1 Tax=Flavobacterium sp. J372 TaxID=2898436 RepID=UPI0021511D7D|nr:T9SS type A sorting domain-containing protein [Flavobacterium sp. J372]MCR5862788.1 T9SS type A sorting domain-containing protein [Flavobacterium sp. J372]
MYGELGIGAAAPQNTPQPVDCPVLGATAVPEQLFVVYPNPVSDVLVISNDKNISIEEVSIIDCTGKTVFRNL